VSGEEGEGEKAGKKTEKHYKKRNPVELINSIQSKKAI